VNLGDGRDAIARLIQLAAAKSSVSAVYASKKALLQFYDSQFGQMARCFGVIPLGMSDYLFGLESRDRFFDSSLRWSE
jgi:hypothetical protein